MPQSTWTLVADAARARIFRLTAGGDPRLVELEDLVHPESRLRDRDLRTDRGGSTFASHGSGVDETGPEHDPGEHQARVFARQIVDRLERARQDHEFDRLVVVAPAPFLGRLREAMGDPLKATVSETLDKDLCRLSTEDIQKRIRRRS
ncbi:MAG: host attachment protein [Gammaproteobacteria bacterium]|jgi:protein required for attachment to host cells